MDYLNVLEKDEIAIYALRSLYKSFGYNKYRMSKFEEYDLYVRNKDFLVSENIITFTDVDGKLMALKPDVTLSIIKNSKDNSDTVQKLYYNENVYRASNDTRAFKEIMQVGVECIGNIDSECICENVLLAAKSLECIKTDYILDISHMGIIEKVTDEMNISSKGKKMILKGLGEKNIQAVEAVLEDENVDEEKRKYVKMLVSTYGIPSEVITILENSDIGNIISEELNELKKISEVLKKNGCEHKTRIDFSVINNMNYYSGIAFKGFINGIPGGILSGGRYDKLMAKMGKKSGAVGFAVYLDMLDRLEEGSLD